MFVFVDESGCTGMKLGRGSSDHFTLVAVVFRDRESAKAARRAIQQLRVELKRKPLSEFKYNRAGRDCKRRFFEVASKLDFRIHSFTLNKAGLAPGSLSESKRMYRKVTGWTLENLMDSLAGSAAPRAATLIFDACGDREFYDYFQRFAEHLARTRLKNNAVINVRAQASHTEDLLQLADMVCGAIAHHRLGKKLPFDFGVLESRFSTFRSWP